MAETLALFPDGGERALILAEAEIVNLSRVLPPPDSPGGVYLTRVRCLRGCMPELNLPAFDEAELLEMLPWLCAGQRSFDELRNADWLGVLQGKLTHAQRQAVEW